MHLIQNWRQAWRFFSVQALAVIAALPIVWMSLPEEWKASLPPEWLKWIVVVVAIAGIVGRVVDQGYNNVGAAGGTDTLTDRVDPEPPRPAA